MKSRFNSERGMTLFEALMILALISIVSAAAFSGILRLPASLILEREISRLEAELAIAARRAYHSGQTQKVSLALDPPLRVDDCNGNTVPPLWSKPNGEVSFATFCITVRDVSRGFRTDWLTGRLIDESVE